MAIEQLRDLVPKLAGCRILVIGDAFLDEYLIGKATRMSREAPIPVLEFEERRLIPGGAANPAANIVALGGSAILVSVIGADAEATTLRQVLQARGIETATLVVDATRPTTVKTRVMAQMGLRFPQQVARLDRLSRDAISPAIEKRLRAALFEHLDDADAILFSDYQVGLLTPELVKAACDLAHGRVMLTADSQGQFDKYVGFGLVKCNTAEAEAYLRRDLRSGDEFGAAALELCTTLKLTLGMVITRGADGVTIATASGEVAHCPTPAITDVYDTVGAGDTAVAVLTMALAVGSSLADAAMLANYASGLVVRRVGNYSPTPSELIWALENWRV
ncbi:MAG: ribokinase [Anaerolineae bacterium]|nr:ribokinase [Anaerolineae bacterium]